MSAIDQLFVGLRERGQRAFIPFITAGDPSLEFTAQVLPELEAAGASLLEIGVPYSDPIADGPVIQESYTRALHSGCRLPGILGMLERLKGSLQLPRALMISYAIIYRVGVEAFVDLAVQAGVSGLIVPDLLVEESGELEVACRRADVSLIQLVTPTTPPERAIQIAERSSGFVYFVSVTGITGQRTELPTDLVDRIGWLKERTALPICVGFGISTADQVRRLAEVADGVIVGSALVRLLGQVEAQGEAAVRQQLGELTRQLAGGLEPVRS
jgi:tryptophan synthase alpha chain